MGDGQRSWNIFAAAMGWQIFSLTNVSAMSSGVGNPLALHHGHRRALASWTHKAIFNYRGCSRSSLFMGWLWSEPRKLATILCPPALVAST
jgi:hypothetical protein